MMPSLGTILTMAWMSFAPVLRTLCNSRTSSDFVPVTFFLWRHVNANSPSFHIQTGGKHTTNTHKLEYIHSTKNGIFSISDFFQTFRGLCAVCGRDLGIYSLSRVPVNKPPQHPRQRQNPRVVICQWPYQGDANAHGMRCLEHVPNEFSDVTLCGVWGVNKKCLPLC